MMKRNISCSIFYTVALALVLLLGSQASQAFVTIGVSINVAPPELPVYEQPAVPGPGYLWTPGYWAWSADAGSYYWVPGTWVEAPQPGYLWTPGYWGWNDGLYVWNGGYWGTHIGFYGGVNYGFGYGGHGYEGGHWDHGAFQYNSAYSNVRGNTQITNVYNKTVINNTTVNNVSFNGGTGGVHAQATTEEVAAQHEQHLPPVAAQVQHEQGASHNPALLASSNHGHPPIAATARPAVFTGAGVVAAHGAVPVSHTAEVAPHPGGFTGGAGGAGGAPAHVTPPVPAHVNSGAGAVVPGAPGPSGGPPHGTVPAAKIQHTGPPAGTPPPKAPPAKAPPREPREEHGSEPR
ncbi:MAG TPA: YXWGXW repeat-containing protein [Steroidobacteraceae bacterium]|nr:YXWGXW repeat-containing protein [Steroidobacteraceae bacterium]